MAREVYDFAVTIPSGTAVSAPQVTTLSMPPRVVRSVTVRIPPGPRGEVGFAIGAAGTAVLPRGDAQWIVDDDQEVSFDLTTPVDSGAWQLRAYNTGSFAHTLYVRFAVDLPGAGSPTPSNTAPVVAGVELTGTVVM